MEKTQATVKEIIQELKYKFENMTKYGKTNKCWLNGMNNSCTNEVWYSTKL